MTVEIPVRPDEFLLDLLEDEAGVPCQAYRPCEVPAAWAYRCEHCSWDHQFCDAHRRSVDENVEHGHVHCAGGGPSTPPCGAPLPSPVPWRPL